MDSAKHNFPKTVFFVNARGVFQGGGCRAVAHAGAYEAATNCGVRFSEVAGTSAGAIIAALIGAGADPDFVLSKLSDLDFRRFMRPPEKSAAPDSLPHWLLNFLPLRFISKFYMPARIAYYGGCYSSLEIEIWVDDLLAQLLPSASRPVKFSELVLSTKVVTTDIGSGTVKIWGTDETPNESVALAVRASCSIPVFFQPVAVGATRHVDGGLLSNLPAFVFSGKSSRLSLGGRVLSFALVDNFDPPKSWTLGNTAKRLIAAAVDGAVDVQVRAIGDASIVRIGTAGVLATDFDKVNDAKVSELIENGRRATTDFILNEGLLLGGDKWVRSHAADVDEFNELFVHEAIQPGIEMIFSQPSTLWFWQLFPTVLAWRAAGARVRVYAAPNLEVHKERLKENQRREMLRRLGVEFNEVPELPWRGVIVRRKDESRNSAFITNANSNVGAPYGVVYVGSTHNEIIRMLSAQFGMPDASIKSTRSMLFASDPSDLIAKLKRGVFQYSPANVSITQERVKISDVLTINRRVRTYKLRQIEALADVYKRNGVELFAPARIELDSGAYVSEITPPVVEVRGSKCVALEGNTRFLYSYFCGEPSISALVVRGVNQPLPGKPVELRRVLLSSREIPSEERIHGFDYGNFRNIERAARPLE